jgi:REP element-mobilizing transposase RayT
MGRRPRIHYPGAVYHVMARGVDGMTIFTDDSERRGFLATLERLRREASARVIAYCLMGNHFHLALQVGAIRLSSIMHRLLTSHATRFNRRHERVGHLFQARHEAIVCLDEAYLFRLINYIHQNPVRAGLVKKARDWRWSSVDQFPSDGSDDDFSGFDPWQEESRDTQALLRASIRMPATIEQLAEGISARSGVPVSLLRSTSRMRWVVSAKRALALEAVKNGHEQRSVAAWLKTTRTTVSNYLVTC